MVDELLEKSRTQLRRRLPDFSPLALELLHSSCLAAHKQVQQYLSQPSESALQALAKSVDEIHNTLQLLGKHGASLVSNEWRLLIKAINDNSINDEEACAHTLLLASEKMSDYVAHLRKPGAIDSAIPLLPVINSCRACRGDALLSEVLVMASGIALPRAAGLPSPGDVDLLGFTHLLAESKMPLMQALLAWFRNDGSLETSLNSLQAIFSRLAQSCDAPTTLQALVPTFESAAFICHSIVHNGLDNDAAVQRLFAQLERALNNAEALKTASKEKDFTSLVPDELVTNLLYYVALSTSSTPKAVSLRRRFRLERYIDRGVASDRSGAVFDGVGDRIADSIRDSLDAEIDVARQWLSQASRDESHPDYQRMCTRMAQLEPALQLLSAEKSLLQLRALIVLLNEQAAPERSAGKRLQLAEILIRLEHEIDNELAVLDSGSRIVSVNAAQANQQACLNEAQRRLLFVEEHMLHYFDNDKASASDQFQFELNNAQASLDELSLINSALQVLPLPEVSPLIGGVQHFIKTKHNDTLTAKQKSDLATILVSLGFYLNSVFDSNGTAGQLLLDAENALFGLQGGNDETHEETLDETTQVHLKELQAQQFLTQALERFGDISSLQTSLARAQSTQAAQSAIGDLRVEYAALAKIASEHDVPDVVQLADANVLVLENATPPLSTESTVLLSESVAVLPQLINQWQSPSDQVQGFDKLLQALELSAKVEERRSAIPDTSSNLSSSSSLHNDDEQIGLDNTLEHVFYKECDAHLATLSAAVTTALASRNWGKRISGKAFLADGFGEVGDQSIDPAVALPSRDMIRALHTLTGSAQTVNAQGIVEIAQPLQKAVLIKQRNNESFTRQETQYISSLVSALKEELSALKDGHEVSDEARSAKSLLKEFVASSQPWLSDAKTDVSAHAQQSNSLSSQHNRNQTVQTAGQALASNDIASVFDEEARNLLSNMRNADQNLPVILADLHTLKGSARMAGQAALADAAHTLEATLQAHTSSSELANTSADSPVDAEQVKADLDAGLAQIQTLLLGAPVVQSVSQKDTSTGVSEAGFSNMLALASKASVAQAQLGDSLLQLRHVYRDIETSSERLQKLAQKHEALDTAAGAEMLSDLNRAHQVLADLLMSAESHQSIGSRANASLQQSLIRAQLVQIGEAEPRLRQAVKDVSISEEKQLNFSLEGGELTIDRALFRQLQAPLEHLLRNAVVHGIESVSERLAIGKAAKGNIELHASIDGTDLLITVQDDGAGIDIDHINEELVAQNKAGVSDVEELRAVLCESGFSTISEVDQLAGRGLGLASVSQSLDTIGGRLLLSTRKDKGTRFTLRVPQQIVVNQVVLVESGKAKYAIPVNYVQSVYEDDDVEGMADIQYNGEDYSCQNLQELLQPVSNDLYPRSEFAQSPHRVLVSAQGKLIALCVDKVIGYREIIAQPLGQQLAALNRYLGGCVLSDGTPVLITDLNRLLEPSRSLVNVELNNDNFVKTARFDQPARTALVVDDSITMRVAAEQLLETLGFVPILARDGEEGLAVLRSKQPDVLLLDIDMPRINGFDLLRRLRQFDPDHDLPIIMISTREAKEDRELAFELGAKHYLQKPYKENTLKRALQEVGLV